MKFKGDLCNLLYRVLFAFYPWFLSLIWCSLPEHLIIVRMFLIVCSHFTPTNTIVVYFICRCQLWSHVTNTDPIADWRSYSILFHKRDQRHVLSPLVLWMKDNDGGCAECRVPCSDQAILKIALVQLMLIKHTWIHGWMVWRNVMVIRYADILSCHWSWKGNDWLL